MGESRGKTKGQRYMETHKNRTIRMTDAEWGDVTDAAYQLGYVAEAGVHKGKPKRSEMIVDLARKAMREVRGQ